MKTVTELKELKSIQDVNQKCKSLFEILFRYDDWSLIGEFYNIVGMHSRIEYPKATHENVDNMIDRLIDIL